MKYEVFFSGKTVYTIDMDADTVLEAITWIKEHNGNAPDSVKDFLDGMQVAFLLEVNANKRLDHAR